MGIRSIILGVDQFLWGRGSDPRYTSQFTFVPHRDLFLLEYCLRIAQLDSKAMGTINRSSSSPKLSKLTYLVLTLVLSDSKQLVLPNLSLVCSCGSVFASNEMIDNGSRSNFLPTAPPSFGFVSVPSTTMGYGPPSQ
mmetsp:Transcript_12963/g.14884  ORF Transcript_12963/g.14884 Transcript_12963/m.14884 type:complete len:137 (-) Transcript_12963:806-1216(-)